MQCHEILNPHFSEHKLIFTPGCRAEILSSLVVAEIFEYRVESSLRYHLYCGVQLFNMNFLHDHGVIYNKVLKPSEDYQLLRKLDAATKSL